MSEDVSSLALISDARRALSEARTLPELQRVMAAAGAAVDVARRQTRWLEAQGIATDIVEQANAAANDAAAVRIEAQAKAGSMLYEMAENGQRASRGGAQGGKNQHGAFVRPERLPPTLHQMGVSAGLADRWRKVAGIPEEVRQRYVDTVQSEKGGEITTAGLMRFHATREAAEADGNGGPHIDQSVQEVMTACRKLTAYDPQAIADWYLFKRRKTDLRQLHSGLLGWVTKLGHSL